MKEIAIAGAGLVGPLLACLLAKRGYKVSLYERRADPRVSGWAGGRSINLALSSRGLHALQKAGLADEVRDLLIPMHGRMVHDTAGKLFSQPYGKEGQFINSVSRGDLNIKLLERADAYQNVEVHFGWKCEEVDVETGLMKMVHTETAATREVQPDLIIGADGAFSAVRAALQKNDRFNYSQYYIPYGYKELSIEPLPGGKFQMDPNALHIWPRKQFMLIALPNADGSFTCTLFLDFEGEVSFEALKTQEAVKHFFETYFADLLPMIPDYMEQFFANPTSSLVTVRCSPWNRGRVMLIGDAAHAIVPFYGQGMNAGFEDCSVLMRLLDQYEDNWSLVRPAFQEERIPDANAIAELALRNFVEMRDLVADPAFILRKKIEGKLHEMMPDKWLPLYSMVTFTDIPYSRALALGQQQDVIMERILKRPDVHQWETEAVMKQIAAQAESMLA